MHWLLKGLDVTKYNPAKEIPALIPKNQLAIESRRNELQNNGRLTRVEHFEVLLIEAILAAASKKALKTVGEAWGPIQFRLANPPREMTWGLLKAQMDFAGAADAVIKLMSA